MEGNLSLNRSNRRLTPRKPVTVAVQDGDAALAYGVITNISESGACVVTDTFIGQGRIVLLRMSFYRQSDLFETEARIVWSEEEIKAMRSMSAAVLQGVQFTGLSDPEQSRLRKLLDSPDFVPGAVVTVTPEFEDLVSTLRRDLHKLGSKLRRETDSSD
jgi:hypothetical protein